MSVTPVCLLNAEFFIGDQFDPTLLAYPFAPLFGKWLDENDVKGNAANEAIARRMVALFAGCEWLQIREPLGGLKPIVDVYRRLVGLVGAPLASGSKAA